MCWPVYQRLNERSLINSGGPSTDTSSGKAADAADIARTAKLLRLLRSVRILRVIRALKWVKKLGRRINLIARLIIFIRAVHHDDYPGNSPSQAVHEAYYRFIRHLRHHRMFPVWPNIANAVRKHVAHSFHSSPASYAWRLVRNSSGTVNCFQELLILETCIWSSIQEGSVNRFNPSSNGESINKLLLIYLIGTLFLSLTRAVNQFQLISLLCRSFSWTCSLLFWSTSSKFRSSRPSTRSPPRQANRKTSWWRLTTWTCPRMKGDNLKKFL